MEKLYVHKKHVIEYSDAVEFTSGMMNAVNNIIHELTDNSYFNDEDCIDYSREIEIDHEEFCDLITALENMTDEEFNKYDKPDFDIDNVWNRQFVIDNFKKLSEQRDTENTYIYLTWF